MTRSHFFFSGSCCSFIRAVAISSSIGLAACGGGNDSPNSTQAGAQPAVAASNKLLAQNVASSTGVPKTPHKNPSTIQSADATFTVNVETDTSDSNPGDGQCLDADGKCSLRAAIQESNSSPGFPPEVIALPAGTYILSQGELAIENSLDIQGAGADKTFIDGNESSRAFAIHGATSPILHFSGITVQNSSGGFAQSGGGIFIDEKAYLALSQSVVRDNKASIFGGGISVAGQLQLIESTVQGNSLPLGSGGGQTSSGGGIFVFSTGNVKINKSTISGNAATRGGGIRNAGGHIEMSNSTISGNTANTRGGGIMNLGTLFIAYSVIAFNAANASLTGTSEDAFGGGIYNVSGLDAAGAVVAGTISMGNTIVAGNTDRRFRFDPNYSPDCYSVSAAAFPSFRGNLVGIVNTSCNLRDSIWGDLRFDQAGTPELSLDPLLNPLANNGGLTRTHALRTGSPAIDKGTGVTSAAFFDCPAVDQRAMARPVGENCDVGAYEGPGV